MPRVVVIGPTDPTTRLEVAAYFSRFDLAVLTPATNEDALALVGKARGSITLIADADRGGVALAQAARKARQDVSVVFTALSPQKVASASPVQGAPVVRSPAPAHQLYRVVIDLVRPQLSEAA
jgi:uncharacterized membrane protein